MKRSLPLGRVATPLATVLISLSLCVRAAPLPSELPERGPHHRLVTTDSGGYVALANGSHYLDGAEWKESDPTIDLHPNGAVALRLPQKILFGQSPAAGVDILTPDGLHLRGAPRAIVYFDALDGRTVVLGTLKDPPTSAAELHPPNVVVYPDAFEGVRASVRYVVDKGSIIQCVVLAENLPDPALFAMNADSVRIEIWNGFSEAPAPQQSETVVRAETDPVLAALMEEPSLVDSTLDFGQVRMIPGKSFLLSSVNGNPAPGADIPGSAPVFKRWLETDEASWLIESVEYIAAREQLARLQPSSITIDPNTAGQFVADEREFPVIPDAQPVNLPMRVVSAPPSEDGFCIDYTLVYSTASWTFQSGVTYLVDGSFTISSSTVIQTNAILKYRRNAVLTVSGTLTTPSTGPPAILTSFDDYTAGELIPGGTPVGYIGSTALSLYNVFNYYGTYVENLEIRHFKTAISDYSPSATHIIRNCRLHVCQIGLNAYYTTVTLSNLVACAVPTLYTNSGYSSITTSSISTDCSRTAVAWGGNQYGQRDLPSNLTNVIAVAGGWKHSLVLKADGTVSAFGTNNDFGQLNVPVSLTNVIGIAARLDHNLALRSDGTVVAWGRNMEGQTNVPAGLTNVIGIAAGYYHSLALRSDGTVIAWGNNSFGITNVPAGVTNAVAIVAGVYHNTTLLSNGTVVAWGQNIYGETNVPLNLTNVVGIAGGSWGSVAIKTNGVPIAWGLGYFGETNVPQGLSNVMALAAGFAQTVALKRDGTVEIWGCCGSAINLSAGLSGVTAVAAGLQHNLAVRAGPATPVIITQPQTTQRKFVGGTVTFTVGAYSITSAAYQWRFNGTNIAGATNASLTLTNLQVADAGTYTVVVSNSAGTLTSAVALLTVVAEPIILVQPSDLRVLAGSNVTFSLTLSNAVGVTNFWQLNGTTVLISSGSNYIFTASAATHGIWTVISSNQVGATLSDPWTLQVVLPGQVIGWGDTGYDQTNAPYPLTNLVAVAAGEHHSLGLKEDGTVVGWGTTMFSETIPPSGLNDVIAIGAGVSHSIALKTDGTVVAWGYSSFGQTNVPAGLSSVKAIAAGYWHNLALKTNGTVVAWGYNGNDQTNVPVALTNAIAISAGWQHSLALRSDGTVCAWGMSNNGQCDVPAGATNVVAISAGIWHSLALKADGTVIGWGANTYGEANPPAGLSNVLAIAGGGQFSLALKNDGTVVAWGKGFFGVTNVPAPLGDVYAISAGFNHALALTYSSTLNYIIEPSRDLLLICNTNCADSVAVMNYYRTNRPMVATANVLGIGGAISAIERYPDLLETTNTLVTPFVTWLTNNPTKRPAYVIMFYGVPASTCFTTSSCVYPFVGHPSSSYLLWSVYPNRKPFVTHINMRTTQDCFAYVDKLANFGTNYSPGKIYISPSSGGYGNTNYYFDDVRNATNLTWIPGVCASNGVVAFGGSASQITHVLCYDCYSSHLFNCTNVAGYLYWGGHASMGTGSPTNGQVRFYGDSWHIMLTIESYNGHWVPLGGQTTFHDYFVNTAFGGTNYSQAAVGAITHTDEPGISGGCPPGGVGNSFLYFGLWHAKRNFGICAWSARGMDRFQAVGDPFVVK